MKGLILLNSAKNSYLEIHIWIDYFLNMKSIENSMRESWS